MATGAGSHGVGFGQRSMATTSHRYRRHEPEKTSLYPIVERHLATLTGELTHHEANLPAFVLDEFRSYLRCGRLEHGFIRVKCTGCRHEHLVAFSCKRRGFCPSCGARRMIETSAHLVDHVLPEVPVRQWVLSFPWPLRMLFASRPQALSRCLDVIIRAIETGLIHRAGLTRASRARTGVVTLIQRFGSALNLNVHLHMLVLDGVYTFENDKPRFRRVNAPDREHLATLLNRIIARVTRRLVRDGLLIEDPEQPWLDLQDTDTLDVFNSASTRYRIAIGPGAGGKTLTLKHAAPKPANGRPKPFTVDRDGFSLNAAVACQPHQRQRLERLARYVTRPAVCLERLSTNAAGQVVYELKRPFRDGTSHIVFSPADFMARLAALVPRPRSHLTRYHGVFAPNSPFRRSVVPKPPAERVPKQTEDRPRPTPVERESDQDNPLAPLTWAQRLKRVFEIDITVCPHCGGRLRFIADVTDPEIIRSILTHLRGRAPPDGGVPRQAPMPATPPHAS